MRASSLERLIGRMQACGIYLTHPSRHDVTLLTDDDQVSVSTNSAHEMMLNARPLNLKLWLDSDTDIVLTIRLASEVDILEFDLDGLNANEADRATSALLWSAVTDLESIGMVSDGRLPDSTTNWEAYFFKKAAHPKWTPELLWMRVDDTHSSLNFNGKTNITNP